MSSLQEWRGIFYGEEFGNALPFDLSPDEWIRRISEMADNPQFAIAGAYFDLVMHGYYNRAGELFSCARIVWPDSRWELLERITKSSIEGFPHANFEARKLLFNAISHIFGGMVLNL